MEIDPTPPAPAAVATPATHDSERPRPRFEIKKYNAVALWAWGMYLWHVVTVHNNYKGVRRRKVADSFYFKTLYHLLHRYGCGQLRDLSKSHYGRLHRVPG